MKRLIVTADDFGLAAEVNEAIERAHRHGTLSAASLMVAAPAATAAVNLARRLPGLRVGLHLTLVEDWPLLPPADIPDLIGASGRLRSDLATYGFAVFTRPALRRQVTREVRAQFEAFRATGLTLDHVDAHQHFHLHPTVLGAILAIGRDYGMRALRVPIEPPQLLAAVEPARLGLAARIASPWAKLMLARVRAEGLVTADHVLGLAWSGAMTETRMAGLIAQLPPGLTEIYTHPATAGGFAGAAPGYRYEEELAALVSPRVAEAVWRSGAILGGYGDGVPN